MNDTSAAMLTERWSAETRPDIKAEALALRSQIRRAGRFN